MFNDVKIRGRNAEPWVGKRASKLTMAGRSPVSDFKISSGEIVEIQAPDCSPMFTKVIDVGGPEIPRFPTMSGPPSPGRKALTVTFARGDFLPPRPAWSATQRKISNDFCPVKDDLLGEMYRANENGLPQLVESVSSDVRAMLALFCYRRSHLHSLALSIAASCSERELIQLGGRVGSTLYALSRETRSNRAAPSSSYGNRKPITLSTKPLSTFSPVDDELDEEDFAQAVTA